MAKAHIEAGACGFYTDVEANMEEKFLVKLKIESSCKHIQKLAADLTEVNALEEISYRRGTREVLSKAAQYCAHAACPVPVGIIKTVEVAAGLALPKIVTIEIEK